MSRLPEQLLPVVLQAALALLVTLPARAATSASAVATVVVRVQPRISMTPQPPTIKPQPGPSGGFSATFDFRVDAGADEVAVHVVALPADGASGGGRPVTVATVNLESPGGTRLVRDVAVKATWPEGPAGPSAAGYGGKVKLIALVMP